MRIHTILVPYDSGHRGIRMGRGPLHLSEQGASRQLRDAGHEVVEAPIDVAAPLPMEVGTSFAVYRALATQVCASVTSGAFPFILAGNCGSALGTASGIHAALPNGHTAIGVIWLDAHADYHTPDTTTSGFLDGMSLAALAGRGWQALTSSIPGFRPVSDAHVVLVGARDLDPAEEDALVASRVMRVEASRMQSVGAAAALDDALTALARHVSRVYVHIDLDVHDPAEAQANQYAVPGGLSAGSVRDLVRVVGSRFEIVAVALTAFDPSFDRDGRMLEVALKLIRETGNGKRETNTAGKREAGSGLSASSQH